MTRKSREYQKGKISLEEKSFQLLEILRGKDKKNIDRIKRQVEKIGQNFFEKEDIQAPKEELIQKIIEYYTEPLKAKTKEGEQNIEATYKKHITAIESYRISIEYKEREKLSAEEIKVKLWEFCREKNE